MAIRRILATIALAAIGWTAVALFFAGQMYAMYRQDDGIPWNVALSLALPRWWAWGLLSPAVFLADRRLGRGLNLAQRVALHIPLGVMWTALAISTQFLIRQLLPIRPPDDLGEFFLGAFPWDLVVYAALAAVSVSRDYARQLRTHEERSHEQALQTADLQRRLAEANLQSLRAQIQPHFLFNALNTVSAFTDTNPQHARRLMRQLGELLRASLTHASRPMVTLAEELTFLDDYLGIESARFGERISTSVEADDEALHVMVPSFLLQPLVENALRHGLYTRRDVGHLSVTAARRDSRLQLRVCDDGVGLKPGWTLAKDAGVGLRNLAARLKHMYGRDDLLNVVPLATGGVEVRLDLPLGDAER